MKVKIKVTRKDGTSYEAYDGILLALDVAKVEAEMIEKFWPGSKTELIVKGDGE